MEPLATFAEKEVSGENLKQAQTNALFCSEDGRQTFYEPDLKRCDYDENVDCGDRPICDIDNENCYEEGQSVCAIADCSQDGFVAEGPCQQ